ncbi:alpha/beta-hydrolase [Lophiostoma macrostomum CBS 122681]|uniref:Alpha/beta-hydrolase n=1 Tax=Lophiostoma macrostomum CBS 122681 TaxID=1314788 RepID=A0A6A6SKB8_9PLEO|nr:alpha/beta-hydrolase [Lophiostoma macrostomum CBS 122681]
MFSQAIFGTSWLDSTSSSSVINKTHAFLATAGFSNPTWTHSAGGNALCISGTISVSASATNTKILWSGPANNFELTEWLTDFMRLDSTLFARMLGGDQVISDTFPIFGKLCGPATSNSTAPPDTVQILTHGGTLDSSYWDFTQNYSYIDYAASQNQYTFSYDRLGSGLSSRPDALQTVQIPLQTEILHILISHLRTGVFSSLPFKRVIGVGHSLGSALTQSLASKYAEDLDALILMGHSNFHAGSGVFFAGLAQQIARTVAGTGERFAALGNGYMTFPRLAQCAQWQGFVWPYFEESVFEKLLDTYGANAIGETLTLIPTYVPVPAFTGPVLVLNGRQDGFYCQGNCLAQGRNIAAETLSAFFPNAGTGSKAVVVENRGHSINLHLGAIEVFEEMVEWVEGLDG